ncbi:type IX secretion system protein PorD [Tellurirhabdus bombi]|uniref:type IX secretion system protein PorD n=1 Tax=Tellurirhabdus bombi TaxID=2907205 RepID=UPI001F36A99D|nr:DUF4835 family protein [Tellurirhabdus bombi]
MKPTSILSLLAVLLLCLLGRQVHAQELNCQVIINTEQTDFKASTDRQIFPQLQAFITDFMNNRRWTNDNYSPEERINCRLQINVIRVPVQNTYECRTQILVTRPVYGTGYETVTLRYMDNTFNFNYRQNDPMYFNENTYQNELTSLLAFHAMIILGTDYDTFGKQGGKPFYQRAFNIMNLAPSGAGWNAQGDLRNRYWMIENLQSQQFIPFHEALYTYHRQALDTFAQNPAGSRQQVIGVLSAIQQVSQQRPNSIVINTFFDAKGEELYNILYEGTRDERQKAFTVLSSLDPSKTELYRKLLR